MHLTGVSPPATRATRAAPEHWLGGKTTKTTAPQRQLGRKPLPSARNNFEQQKTNLCRSLILPFFFLLFLHYLFYTFHKSLLTLLQHHLSTKHEYPSVLRQT